MKRLRSVVAMGLLMLAVTLIAGCTTGFVEDAARGSVASFLNNVFTTAVNATINP
ncbi:MAG: hypothetical protein HY763_06870 [Planctomycetes bacterium]|nr:hypothetical protein [Planctomycetota bacterium]